MPFGSRPVTDYRGLRASLVRFDHSCGRPRGDRARGKISRHHRVGADDAAVADRHPAGHHAIDAEPAVGADPHWPLRREALLGDRHVGIVEAVVGIADEAAIGEHRVVADLDRFQGRQHRVAVEEAAGADLDPSLRRQRQPAARLEQRSFADPQTPFVERLEDLALDRLAHVEAAACRVASQSPLPGKAAIALIPAALRQPYPPTRLPSDHVPSFPEAAGVRSAGTRPEEGIAMGMFEMSDAQVAEWRQQCRDLVASRVNGEEVLAAAGFRQGGATANYMASKAQLGGLVYAGIKMMRKKKAGGLPDK